MDAKIVLIDKTLLNYLMFKFKVKYFIKKILSKIYKFAINYNNKKVDNYQKRAIINKNGRMMFVTWQQHWVIRSVQNVINKVVQFVQRDISNYNTFNDMICFNQPKFKQNKLIKELFNNKNQKMNFYKLILLKDLKI